MWERVSLAPGESKPITIDIKPAYVSIFNEQKDRWNHVQSDYEVFAGPSSDKTPIMQDVHVAFRLHVALRLRDFLIRCEVG